MDHHTPGDGLEPIAGNRDEIWGQVERLTKLAAFLDDQGSLIRQMGIGDWSGDAADLSWDLRLRLAVQFVRASDSHAAAAAALRSYWNPLSRLQPMGDMVIAGARASGHPVDFEAARQTLDRFRDELAPIGAEAAEQIRQATRDLEQLRRILPDLATVVPAMVEPSTSIPRQELVRRREPAKAPDEPARSVFAVADSTYAQRVAQLNAEIFEAFRDGPTIQLPPATA